MHSIRNPRPLLCKYLNDVKNISVRQAVQEKTKKVEDLTILCL